MKIFVVGGKSGSGKGEVAKMIEEYYIYKLKKAVVTEFSKYLKNFAKELTDWDGVSQRKPRDFLQQFGSKIREYDKYFFTKRMIEDVNIYELAGIDVLMNLGILFYYKYFNFFSAALLTTQYGLP